LFKQDEERAQNQLVSRGDTPETLFKGAKLRRFLQEPLECFRRHNPNEEIFCYLAVIQHIELDNVYGVSEN